MRVRRDYLGVLVSLMLTSALVVGCEEEEATEEPAETTESAPTEEAQPEEEVVAEAEPEPARDEPWRTEPSEVDEDVACPEGSWVAVTHRSIEPTELVGPFEHFAAYETGDGNHNVVLSNYDLPEGAMDINWANPEDQGQVRVRFTINADDLAEGTTYVHQEDAEHALVSPGVGYVPEGGGSGGIGLVESENSSVTITSVTDEQICGRVAINDGYVVVRGAFTARRAGSTGG